MAFFFLTSCNINWLIVHIHAYVGRLDWTCVWICPARRRYRARVSLSLHLRHRSDRLLQEWLLSICHLGVWLQDHHGGEQHGCLCAVHWTSLGLCGCPVLEQLHGRYHEHLRDFHRSLCASSGGGCCFFRRLLEGQKLLGYQLGWGRLHSIGLWEKHLWNHLWPHLCHRQQNQLIIIFFVF